MSAIRPIVIVNFDKYHPLNKTVSAEVRAGGPLKWVRWETDSHRDADLLDLPSDERWLWPVLVGLAGKDRRHPDGSRSVRMTPAQLAREACLTLEQVTHALDHLLERERIRFAGEGDSAGGHVGGADHREGGHVPTDLRTDVPTDLQTNGHRFADTDRESWMAGAMGRVRSA